MKNQKRGFTLIELLVFIAIISILASILFPVFARARENARRASCMSNMKQIGLAVMMYTQDYDEYLPQCGVNALAPPLLVTLQPYTKSTQLIDCPSNPYPSSSVYNIPGTIGSYGWNFEYLGPPYFPVVSLSGISNPTQLVLMTDTISWNYDIIYPPSEWRVSHSSWGSASNGPEVGEANNHGNVDDRHLGMTNVLWADGHVKAQNYDSLVGPTTTLATRDKFFNPSYAGL